MKKNSDNNYIHTLILNTLTKLYLLSFSGENLDTSKKQYLYKNDHSISQW